MKTKQQSKIVFEKARIGLTVTENKIIKDFRYSSILLSGKLSGDMTIEF